MNKNCKMGTIFSKFQIFENNNIFWVSKNISNFKTGFKMSNIRTFLFSRTTNKQLFYLIDVQNFNYINVSIFLFKRRIF